MGESVWECFHLVRDPPGLFFHDRLHEKLLALNGDRLDDALAREVVKRMERVQPTIEGQALLK